jgi:diguanylate cyclase (GGDEF)-like protein
LIEEQELHFTALSSQVGSAWKVGERIPLKGTATEWGALNRKSLMEPDLEKDRIFTSGEEYLKRGIRSIVYLPLITKDKGIGSLIIGSRSPNNYNPTQISLLERLAAQISTSIANSKLYASAEQRARIDELTGLYNRRHFDETLKHEIDRHSRYGNLLSLVFIDLDNFKTYNDSNGHPAGDKTLAHIGHLMLGAIRNIDFAFRYGGDEFAIIMPNTSDEDALSVTERIRSIIATETAGDQISVTASFGLASWPSDGLSTDHLIDAADRALYHAKRTGGNRICLVSQMLPSSTEIQEEMPDSEKETLHIIYALAATIEARDTYTYGHSQKVRTYAVALAEALGLPSEKVVVISHSALLHDIGKIGILDGILNKVGKLTAAEFELVKTHPQLSRTIVNHVASLTPCLQAIHQHHEHWDGKGYPNGLKGEAITIEARILAITDAFDAMTSKRPYRDPLSTKASVQELKRCAGTQFDPSLIDAFIPIALATTPEELVLKQNPGKPKH